MARSKTPETILRNSVMEYLLIQYPTIQCWVCKNGATYDPIKKIFRKPTKYSRDGLSDILGVFPSGHMLAIETKIKPRKPSQAQVDFLQMISERGGVGILAFTLDDVIDLLKKVLIDDPSYMVFPLIK